MNFPDKLRPLLIERIGKNPGWFADQYAKAVERIEDRTSDPENPYYYSALNDQSAFNDGPLDGPVLLDEFGGEERVEAARDRAFELLALADLAEIVPEPVVTETQAEVETK